MTSTLRFDDKVAIVTGAGGGLGRSHARLLAARGAKVLVNDLGGSMHGKGTSESPADKVVAEIREAGGEALPNYLSVEEGAGIVDSAMSAWGRVDIVINNAGILRDISFHKMDGSDWDLVYRVHVLGAFRVTRAAWPHMRAQRSGKVLFTASAAGLYGNFGQANYGSAKLALLGMANTLAVEGASRGIQVNTIAPMAASRLTEDVIPEAFAAGLKSEHVSPLAAWLCHDACEETGGLFEVGGGCFSKVRWQRSGGLALPIESVIEPEVLRERFAEICDFTESSHPSDIMASMAPLIENAQKRSTS